MIKNSFSAKIKIPSINKFMSRDEQEQVYIARCNAGLIEFQTKGCIKVLVFFITSTPFIIDTC